MPKYIEYEALKNKINDAQAEKDKFPFNSLYEIGYHNGLTMALTLAMQSPDSNVAHVRHGMWLISHDGYYPYCSECKEEPKGGEMTYYCPNCGAIMRNENDKEVCANVD